MPDEPDANDDRAWYEATSTGLEVSAPYRSPPVSTAVMTAWEPARCNGTEAPIVTPRRPAADSGTPSSQRPSQPELRLAVAVPAIQVAVEEKWLWSLPVWPTPWTMATLPAS